MGLLQKVPNYEIKRLLHKGNRCYLFDAIRLNDKQKVLIKVPLDAREGSLTVTRLYNEFEIAKDISHKNIIKYYELVDTDKQPFLVKEYFDSIRLKEFIPENGLEIKVFLEIGIQIVEALIEIHKNDIIHQLLKPSNVLVDPKSNKVKIHDFGRATYNYEIKSQINNFIDSIEFISPEQTGRINRTIDYRTDFYSLGITFYKMLTGDLPFKGNTPLEIMHNHIAREVVPPNKVKASIPQIISNIVVKLLAKNNEDRYQSAEGILADLRFCQSNISSLDQYKDYQIAEKDYSEKFRIPQKLYGREYEIKTLHEQFEKVCNGDTKVMLVTGYSGIGKSAIVNELLKEITIKDAYFATGKYEHLKKNVAYSAIALAFKEVIRQILGESDTKISLWKEKLLDALGNNGQVIIDIIPELEYLIGEQPSVEKLGSSENQNRFNMVFQRFISVFDKLAHPLVVFLDDLQWIDLASLNLIKLITAEHLTKSLFFIGAYRSNEVDDLHPAIITIEEVKKTGVETNYINLQPLDFDSVNEWVSDTFLQPKNSTKELTELIISKTEGNPFFVKSFIKSLYDNKLIRYKGEAKWVWDLQEIIATKPTDNVTELMAGNIKRLEEESVNALATASFIGNVFSADTLALVLDEETVAVEKKLEPALRAGMLHKTKETYKFIHDKILEAAFSLIPDELKREKHLEIARLLYNSDDHKKINTNIFSIAEHYNKGVELIKDEDEITRLVELNIKVGKEAKKSAAYKNAGYFFEFASKLIGENAWNANYELAIDLFSEWAEAENMATNFDKAEELFDVVLSNAKNIYDKTKIYQMILVFHENRRRFRAGVDLSVKVLNELGIDYPHPKTVGRKETKQQIERFYKNLGDKGVQDLINLPEIEDILYKEGIGILVSIMVPYWNTYPEQLEFLCYEIVNLSIEKGLCAESSLGFAMLGSTITSSDLGYELSRLSVMITDRFENKFYKTAADYIFYNHVHFWKKALAWEMDRLLDAFQLGMETGNNQWASYCINHYCMRHIMVGTRLDLVKELYDKYTETMYNLKQEAPLTYFNPPKQTVINLLGLSDDLFVLSGSAFNEKVGLEEFEQSKQFSAIGLTYIFKMLIYSVFGEYNKAKKIVEYKELEKCIRANSGQFQQYLGLCLYGLSLSQNIKKVDSKKHNKKLKIIKTLCEEFKEYKLINKKNFGPLYYLLLAESFRLKGRNYKAINCYEKVIRYSKKAGFVYLEGIANELCAKLWGEKKKKKVAETYIKEAYICFKKWGCIPKLGKMTQEYPGLFRGKTLVETVKNQDLTILDSDSLQRATRALSKEIITEKLLSRLIQIIIENAGAQKGYIVLKYKKTYSIESGFDLTKEATSDFKKTLLAKTDLLAETLVRYVIRTNDNIVLQNASENSKYLNEPYIKKNACKSILVMAISYKSNVLGALYLENNLTTNVFSTERVKLIDILLSQSAISLENARLFQEYNNAVNELLEEKSFINTAINTLPDTLFVFEIATGKAVRWNDAFTKISGYSNEEIGSMKAPESYYSPEDLEKASASTSKILKDGHSIVEMGLITKSGKVIPTEYIAGLIKDENDEPKFIVSVGRDITEWKRSQEILTLKNEEIASQNEEYEALNEELQKANIELLKANEQIEESERRYKIIYNNTPVLLHSSDLEGNLISVNEYWLDTMGYTKEEVLGTKASQYLTEASQRKYASIVKEYFETGTLRNVAIQVIRKDGVLIDMLVSSKLFSDAEGNPKHTMTNLVDISKIKEAEKRKNELNKQLIIAKEKAEESDRLKTEFINNMSHEIRTPMNGILGFANLLNKPDLTHHKREFYIKIIQNSGAQLLKIIDDILEISKLGTKQVKVIEKEVSLNDVFLELFSIFDIKAKENKIPLYLKKGLSDEESIIYTDKSKLDKIVSNLLENAMKFTQGGFVEFGYNLVDKEGVVYQNIDELIANKIQKTFIQIYVKDTGVGIHKDKQKAIFERFAQESKEVATKTGGLGLGLSIAKENTELLGGDITVESVKGKGSVFYVTFPYKPIFLIEELKTKDAGNGKRRTYHVLIAEDEEINFIFLETLLEKEIGLNCKIIHAKNGVEAVEFCKQNPDFDMVFMDLKMPGMDGFEATKKIKEFRPELPIIAQTAYTTNFEREKAVEVGCSGFVSKPIEPELLERLIKEHLVVEP